MAAAGLGGLGVNVAGLPGIGEEGMMWLPPPPFHYNIQPLSLPTRHRCYLQHLLLKIALGGVIKFFYILLWRVKTIPRIDWFIGRGPGLGWFGCYRPFFLFWWSSIIHELLDQARTSFRWSYFPVVSSSISTFHFYQRHWDELNGNKQKLAPLGLSFLFLLLPDGWRTIMWIDLEWAGCLYLCIWMLAGFAFDG